MAKNTEALAEIRDNIARYGYHIYAVSGGAVPRYVYTIGNLDRLGAELIFAGGAYYSLDEVIKAIDEVALMRPSKNVAASVTLSLGRFDLCPVDPVWVAQLMLGAIDHYATQPVAALQLVPDDKHRTVDTPDMTLPFSAEDAPTWRWLSDPWPYPVAEDSLAITNLAALRGEAVTEAARWEEREWELFAGGGPDVLPEEVRAVSLAILLGFDPSLKPVTQLAVGKASWREGSNAAWQKWGE